jgi:hypothetical protein
MDRNSYGFPQVVSLKENINQGEILMEALGPSLMNLLKQYPGGNFSVQTVYMITIQLVSKITIRL